MSRKKLDKDCEHYFRKNCKINGSPCDINASYCVSGYKDEKNQAGENEIKVIEPEIIDNNLENIRNNTTLKQITKDDGNIYAKTAPGQNRNLDVDVSVDPEWLPKLLNLEGAGEKYKNIGENELKFIVNILKYNNNTIAYKQAYDCTNLSSDYIENRSSKLKNRSDVADLIQLLRTRMVKQTERQMQWQFSESVANLKFLIDTAKEEIENCREDGKRSYLTMTRVMAIKDAVKELNQMMGYTERAVQISNSVTIVGKEEDLPN